MRNLKKVLSLALALVMLLGMMVVGAGAATSFTDDDKIQNQEAVAVLVGLGVMKGREDNSGITFQPDATLTRAEAAKMIAQLDLGVEAADALKSNGTNTFSDVRSDYWAAGPIDYCVEQGYINGDGAGHFFPNQKVTGVQFASMLLRLLGYDAKVEELVGSQWATKAAALARKAGLTTKVLANNEDMTRDGMAQMSFNALTAPMVEYKGMNITVGDATFTSPATVRLHDTTLLGTNRTYDGKVITATTPIRLCEERFPYLKLRTTEEDNFGHTASVWKYREAEIAGSESTVPADIAITGKVEKTLPDWAKIKDLTKNTGAQLFINGDTSTAVPTNGDGIRALTGNGRLVEIYLSEADLTKFDKIVITDTALAEVTKVVDSNETISVKLLPNKKVDVDTTTNKYEYTNDDVVAATNVVLNTKVGYGDVKKGDLVLVQGYSTVDPKLNEKTTVTSVEQATEVKGFATHKAYSDQVNATYIQIDGEKYYDAYGVMKDFGTIDFNLNTKFDSTLYLDKYGYIMKAIQGEDPNLTTDNLIAVKEIYQTLTDNKIVDMVQGVLSNGQTVNWPLSSDSARASNTIMHYEKQNNGTYKLEEINGSRGSLTEAQIKAKTDTYVVDYGAGTKVEFKSSDVYGKGNGNRFMYSDTVKFIFVDSKEGVTVVDGRQTYNFDRTSTSIVAQALKNGEITAVFVNGKADVADLKDVIFVSSRYRAWDEVITRENGQKVQYYGYTAYDAKGEAIDHFLGVNENMANSFYVADKNADGAYKATHPSMLDNHSMVSGALQVANGLAGDAFVLESNDIDYEFVGQKDTVVKDLSDAKLYIESIPELNAAVNNDYNVTVAVLYNNTDSKAVTPGASEYVKSAVTVFVTEAKKSSGSSDPTTPAGYDSKTTNGVTVNVEKTVGAKNIGAVINVSDQLIITFDTNMGAVKGTNYTYDYEIKDAEGTVIATDTGATATSAAGTTRFNTGNLTDPLIVKGNKYTVTIKNVVPDAYAINVTAAETTGIAAADVTTTPAAATGLAKAGGTLSMAIAKGVKTNDKADITFSVKNAKDITVNPAAKVKDLGNGKYMIEGVTIAGGAMGNTQLFNNITPDGKGAVEINIEKIADQSAYVSVKFVVDEGSKNYVKITGSADVSNYDATSAAGTFNASGTGKVDLIGTVTKAKIVYSVEGVASNNWTEVDNFTTHDGTGAAMPNNVQLPAAEKGKDIIVKIKAEPIEYTKSIAVQGTGTAEANLVFTAANGKVTADDLTSAGNANGNHFLVELEGTSQKKVIDGNASNKITLGVGDFTLTKDQMESDSTLVFKVTQVLKINVAQKKAAGVVASAKGNYTIEVTGKEGVLFEDGDNFYVNLGSAGTAKLTVTVTWVNGTIATSTPTNTDTITATASNTTGFTAGAGVTFTDTSVVTTPSKTIEITVAAAAVADSNVTFAGTNTQV